MMRQAKIIRQTNETDIDLFLDLDNPGDIKIHTGFAFLDHLINLTAFWGRFSLKLEAKGDLAIDAHHTVEDIGLVFGQALYEALGDRKGINRIGNAKVPMDEAITEVNIDFSGRSYLVYNNDEIIPPVIANNEKDIWREYYKAIAQTAKCNIHINYLYGKNAHHLLESGAKAFGLAIYEATRIENNYLLSTKGSIDL